MGTGEEGTPKPIKPPASSAQEAPSTPTTSAYPNWTSSMQAFYGPGGTPPFFASSVASPTPHPFIWGSQHPMMPPYGTPVPYPAMYPPGVYAHPNMAMAQSPVHGTAESDVKASDEKDRASRKKTKGTLGNHASNGGGNSTGNVGNATSGSGNEVGTQSAESGSDGSSDASDDNQDYSGIKKGSFEQMLADGANTVPGNPIPATNLNIGMDLWNVPPSSGSSAMKLRPSPPGVSQSVAPLMSDQWVQDERELKRQKRKQSNRESARRSRLRKQAECEELQRRVDSLSSENQSLRDELQKLSEECQKLTSENNSIKEELTALCGPDAVLMLEKNDPAAEVSGRRDQSSS